MPMTQNEWKPKIVAFCCNWCSYAGADLAGSGRLSYPADIKIIRVPCSCRVNPLFILRAFQRGADGVSIGKEQNAVLAVLDLTDGFGCDLVIETAGTEFTTRQAIEMVHKGATIVLVGYSKSGEMTLPVSLALDKELTFKTVFRYRHIYPMAIDAVASGKINLKGVVTNIFDFDDIQNAMDKSIADKANIVKAVVKIADETKI